jgi:hypothetical protein
MRIAMLPVASWPHRTGLPFGGATVMLIGCAKSAMVQSTGIEAASLNLTVFTASGPRLHFSMMV